MTWSYDPTTVGTVPKNYVRMLIGDTNTNDQQLQDETIVGVISLTGTSDSVSAAMTCCLALQALYARRADLSIDSFRVAMSDRSKNYGALYDKLRIAQMQQPGRLGAPQVGGISISTMAGVAQDSDRVPSRSSVGMMEMAGVMTPSNYYAVFPFFVPMY